MLGYKDLTGKVWADDDYFSSDTNVTLFEHIEFREPHPFGIEATDDSHILKSQRWSTNSFSYSFSNLAPGKYMVRLFWAELDNDNFVLFNGNIDHKQVKGVGVRVFSVSANGRLMIPRVDIFQSVGPYSQLTKEFWVNVQDDGILRLEFNKLIGNPMIQGIEIISENRVVPNQMLAPSAKQGLVSLFYNYSDYSSLSTESSEIEMPDGGSFTRSASQTEITEYINIPSAVGPVRSSSFAQRFAMQSIGYLRIPHPGNYLFTLESNDASQLWIWTDQIKEHEPQFIENRGDYKGSQQSMNVTFSKAAFYPIRLQYYQSGIYSRLKLYWMTPSDDQSRFSTRDNMGHIIPPQFFSHDQEDLLQAITQDWSTDGRTSSDATRTSSLDKYLSSLIITLLTLISCVLS